MSVISLNQRFSIRNAPPCRTFCHTVANSTGFLTFHTLRHFQACSHLLKGLILILLITIFGIIDTSCLVKHTVHWTLLNETARGVFFRTVNWSRVRSFKSLSIWKKEKEKIRRQTTQITRQSFVVRKSFLLSYFDSLVFHTSSHIRGPFEWRKAGILIDFPRCKLHGTIIWRTISNRAIL